MYEFIMALLSNWPFLIFGIWSVKLANNGKKTAWIPFSIGVILNGAAKIGNSISDRIVRGETSEFTIWSSAFFVLFAVAFALHIIVTFGKMKASRINRNTNRRAEKTSNAEEFVHVPSSQERNSLPQKSQINSYKQGRENKVDSFPDPEKTIYKKEADQTHIMSERRNRDIPQHNKQQSSKKSGKYIPKH